MVLYFDLRVKKIFEQGKGYDWPRPERCPTCDSGRLWGHGYVERYFEGIDGTLWMKRYRCADCGAVHTLRPKGYWRRFYTQAETIVKSLKEKILAKQWLKGLRRQSQQYWWQGLKRQWQRRGKGLGRIRVLDLEKMLNASFMVATHSLSFFRIQTGEWGFDLTTAG